MNKKVKKIVKMLIPPIIFTIYRGLKYKWTTNELLIEEQKDDFNLSVCSIEDTNELDFPNTLKIKRKGFKFPFYIRNNTSDVYVYSEIIESLEYNFIASQEPKVIIDAGGNIGLTAIYFARKYPSAKIISIEPEENNFKLLKENTKNYDNIIPLQLALWYKVGEIILLDTGLDNWGFMTEDSANYHKINTPMIQKKHTVKTITIEGLLNDYNIDMIDILKLDIEGAEKEIFENHDLWIDRVRSIIVELHEKMKPGCYSAFKKIIKNFDQVAASGEDFYLSKKGFIKMK